MPPSTLSPPGDMLAPNPPGGDTLEPVSSPRDTVKSSTAPDVTPSEVSVAYLCQ